MDRIKKYTNYLLLIFVIFMLGVLNINSSSNLIPLSHTSGGHVKYRGTNVNVMIPKEYIKPDSEFRAVWVTPISGQDVISFKNQYTFKSQVDSILDKMEEFNLNALIFHVRPYNDALYSSQLNPSSKYFEAYGVDPGWDPLPYVIEEAHKRGIEFHAWLNPYRISNNESEATPESVAARIPEYNIGSNPEYVLVNSKKERSILNPGEPAVREFLIDTVMELIENYDIDAIHFDDYFYIDGIDDSYTRSKVGYNPNSLGIADWRREQVNIFIEDLSREMRAYNLANNRYVQLGISPTGIYKNGGSGFAEGGPNNYDSNGNFITNGSNTGGQEHYASYLYADSKKWVDNEWIDYILPQTYWAFEHTVAGYADIVDWWAKVVRYKNVNFYTGMGLYMGNQDRGNFSWTSNHYEAPNQVKYNTKHESIKGVSIYNYNSLLSSQPHLQTGFNEIKTKMWNSKVLRPEIRTFNSSMLPKVSNLQLQTSEEINILSWNHLPNARGYAIYRSESNVDINNKENLLDIIGFSDQEVVYYEDIVNSSINYQYAVVAINGANKLGDVCYTHAEDVEPETPLYNITINDNINNDFIYVHEYQTYYGNTNQIDIVHDSDYRYLFLVEKGKLISEDKNYRFRVTEDTNFIAYFVYEYQKACVFLNANNDLISFQTFEDAGDIVFPADPDNIGDYYFSRWLYSENEYGDIVYKASYTNQSDKQYFVSIDAGDGLRSEHLEFGEQLEVMAAESDNKIFSYWLVDDEVYSYNETLKIYVYSDLDIKAVFNDEILYRPLINIQKEAIKYDDYFIVVGNVLLPEDVIFVETGVLYSDQEVFDLNTLDVMKIRARRISPNGDFTIKRSFEKFAYFYKGYLSYIYEEKLYTIYTNTFSIYQSEDDLMMLENIVGLIPKHINSDYDFPSQDGLSFTYADGEDSSLFDLNTGTHLVKRVTVQKRTIVATLNNASITFEVNFGVLGEEEAGSYYYGNPGSASKLEPDYSGTFIGWSGYTLTKGNDVLFVGQTIELEGSGLITDSNILKPSTPFTSIGTLYVNTGSKDVSFKIGDIRIQNDNNYSKVLIGSDGTIKQVIKTAVSNTYEITLMPGEAFWSPKYLDKQNGLTWGGVNDFNFGEQIIIKSYLK